tara:strand:- start:25003 stop:26178 length:1176 start_codon:yes stop_codon:yes gene_type:complete
MPHGDRFIFDDNSDREGILVFLDTLRARGDWGVYVNPARKERTFGGFYENIHRALSMALEQGYDYCYLAEDDGQFVRDASGMVAEASEIFRQCEDALVICPWFVQRSRPMYIERADGSKEWRMEYVEGVGAYRTNTGFNTTGVFNLERIRRAGGLNFIDCYGTNFSWNSGHWLKKGYHNFFLKAPYVAMVPWVGSLASGQKIAEGVERSPDRLLMREMTPEEITYFCDRNPEVAPYQEYVSFRGDEDRQPAWFRAGEMLDQYYRMCAGTVASEDKFGMSPIRLPRVSIGDESKITPNAVHIRRYEEYAAGVIEGTTSSKAERSWQRKLLNSFLPPFIKRIFIPVEFLIQNAVGRWRRKYGSGLLSLIKWYVGYLRLCFRLRAERKALPFNR